MLPILSSVLFDRNFPVQSRWIGTLIKSRLFKIVYEQFVFQKFVFQFLKVFKIFNKIIILLYILKT